MFHYFKALLLGLLIACVWGSAPALAAEECVAPVAYEKCPAGYGFRQGTQQIPNPLNMGPPVYLDSKCCRTVVECTKYGTPECPYPPLAKGWAGANIDRPGGDYKNFDLNGEYPSDCRDACSADKKCQAWTYVRPGVQGPRARCWLKASVPPARPNNCCISDVIVRDVDIKVH